MRHVSRLDDDASGSVDGRELSFVEEPAAGRLADVAKLGGDRDPLKVLVEVRCNRDGQIDRTEFESIVQKSDLCGCADAG